VGELGRTTWGGRWPHGCNAYPTLGEAVSGSESPCSLKGFKGAIADHVRTPELSLSGAVGLGASKDVALGLN